MKIKTTLALFALALTPSLAFAECMGQKHTNISASACGEGMVYDSETKGCVLKPTS